MSPYRIVFGFEPRRPIDHSLMPSQSLPRDVREYVEKMKPQLEIIREVVRKNQEDANFRTQLYYNVTAKQPDINIGDRVWIFGSSCKGTEIVAQSDSKMEWSNACVGQTAKISYL